MVAGVSHGPVVGTVHTEDSKCVTIYFGDNWCVNVVGVLIIVWGWGGDDAEGVDGGLVVDGCGGVWRWY